MTPKTYTSSADFKSYCSHVQKIQDQIPG